MTRRLICMRHAKSSWSTQLIEDHDRPLNPRGVVSARALGKWMRENGYVPDLALCSSARRTVETLDGLGFDALETRLELRLYHAAPNEMLDMVCDTAAEVVLLVGHNPGLCHLVKDLAEAPPENPRFHDYPTGATTVFDFQISDWHDIRGGIGKVVDFAIPRELP